MNSIQDLDFPSFELKHSQVVTKRISGWNQMWKTALDDEWAVGMGSSYLFITTEGSDEDWIDLLSKLEKTPLGERTYDGYGTAYICHPFHLQLEEV